MRAASRIRKPKKLARPPRASAAMSARGPLAASLVGGAAEPGACDPALSPLAVRRSADVSPLSESSSDTSAGPSGRAGASHTAAPSSRN